MCEDAITLMKTARDTFPRYTLHDEVHLCNVLFLMGEILGEKGVKNLTLGECEMLVLSAFYHDIGMCYTEENRKKVLKSNRFTKFLEENPWADLKVLEAGKSNVNIPQEVQDAFFRSIHHIRVVELLPEDFSELNIRRDYLSQVCQSHGENIDLLGKLKYDKFYKTDSILCAILLRLADLLDFDITRSPKILYDFQKISESGDFMADREWRKHMESQGFKLALEEEKKLKFFAVCKDLQSETAVCKFLDYIDDELDRCRELFSKQGSTRWKDLYIPEKVERHIERKGYQAGEYCITLDTERVIQLLIGNDIYTSDSVFIRELLQNALDAVRARKMLDPCLKNTVEPQIGISSWYDSDENQWFRIDDTGIGMSKQTILEYFLKIGRSYYQSNEFKRDQERYSHGSFTPISQFGIGILSCFLAGDRLELSTRYYNGGTGLRFNMSGVKGYYSIAEEESGDSGDVMPAIDKNDNEVYRQSAGTSIAVKLKGAIAEDIGKALRNYICYPDVNICYREGNSEKYLLTEQELLKYMNDIKKIQIPIPEEYMQMISQEMPYLKWIEEPYISVSCESLKNALGSEYISGADIEIVLQGKHNADDKRQILEQNISGNLSIQLGIKQKGIHISLGYYVNIHHADIWEYNSPLDNCRISLDGLLETNKKKSVGDEDILFLRRMKAMKDKRVSFEIPFTIDLNLNKLMEKVVLPRLEKESTKDIVGLTEIGFNGISIRKSYDSGVDISNCFRYTVVLLSGEYAPVLDIARERVRSFPLKAAAHIEMLGRKIGNAYLTCKYLYYSELDFKDYYSLYEDEEFCLVAEEILEVSFRNSFKDARNMLKSKKEILGIYVENFSEIFGNYDAYPDNDFYFSRLIIRMLLQKNFDVQWYKNPNGLMEYKIVDIRRESIEGGEKLFLPLTFVKSSDGNTQVLTEDSAMVRQAFNANHPFSVWLIENAELLAQCSINMLKIMKGYLYKSDSSEMIEEVNELLREIEIRTKIRIPNDVWLKERDFIYLF